jgi:hypothetical protein
MIESKNIDKSDDTAEVHSAYKIVSRLEDSWDANLLAFDAEAAGKTEISKAELNKIIRALKKLRKEFRHAIEELVKLRS